MNSDQPASKMVRVSTPLIESVQKLCGLHRRGHTSVILQGLEELIAAVESRADIAPPQFAIDSLIQRLEALEQGDSGGDSEAIANLTERLEKVESAIESIAMTLAGFQERLVPSEPIGADSEADDESIAVPEQTVPEGKPIGLPDPFPEEGLSTAALGKLLGVTPQLVSRIRKAGRLKTWKGGWRATKINGREHRYYPFKRP